MERFAIRKIALPVLLVGAAIAAWLFFASRPAAPPAGPQSADTRAAPVEVARIERGPMELRRTFSGALEATAENRKIQATSPTIHRQKRAGDLG